MLPNMQEWADRCDKLIVALDTVNGTLRDYIANEQLHSPQLREWEPFVLLDGGTTDSNGAATVGGTGSNLTPAANGWEAWVDRVSVTVAGASAAATVANYHGAAADFNLFDFAASMSGNTPSRRIADYNSPVYFRDSQHISIVIAGAVASQSVFVRVEGRRRQV